MKKPRKKKCNQDMEYNGIGNQKPGAVELGVGEGEI